jgi:acid stress-induced BolA-like protein IbaG/YrbA
MTDMDVQPAQIVAMLEKAFPDARVRVEGEGCDLTFHFESASLAAMRPVQRQQAVYSHLSDYVTSGVLHAVSMRFTRPAD